MYRRPVGTIYLARVPVSVYWPGLEICTVALEIQELDLVDVDYLPPGALSR